MQADQTFQQLHVLMEENKNKLKEQVNGKFNEWRDILQLMEQNVYQTIDERFLKF